MTHWNETAVTDAGAEMLNEVMAGRFLTVTAAYGGTGLVDADELTSQSGLVDRKQTLSIIDDKTTIDGRTLTIQITNAAEEYELNQIGIYAKLDAERDQEAEAKMLCLLQDRQEKGAIIVPSANDPTFVLEVYCVLKITSDGRVKVTIDQTGIASIAYLKEALSGKQPTLTGAPGQLIGIGDDGAAKATVYPSNPSILDNWYFVNPINQKGETQYTGGGYSIDRWASYDGAPSVTINNTGIQLGAGDWGQKIEDVKMPPGLYTVSILTDGNELASFAFRITGAYHVEWVTSEFGFQVKFIEQWQSGVNIFYIHNEYFTGNFIAAKLELGPVQTLAHKEGDEWVLNDPPPNYALELAKCQRYYERAEHIPLLMRYRNTLDYPANPADFGMSMYYQTPKRVTPTVTVCYDIQDGEPQTVTVDALPTLFTMGTNTGVVVPAGQWIDINWYEADANL